MIFIIIMSITLVFSVMGFLSATHPHNRHIQGAGVYSALFGFFIVVSVVMIVLNIVIVVNRVGVLI